MSQPSVLMLARPRADLSALVDALDSLGLDGKAVDELDTSEGLSAAVTEAIRTSMFVLVVWDSARLSRASLFEAGLAVGSDRPLAVLDARTGKTAQSTDVVLDIFITVPRMHARLQDTDGLRQELSALIPSLTPLSGAAPKLVRNSAILQSESQTQFSSESVARTAAALNRFDAVVSAPRVKNLRAPDLIAQVPGLESPFNNVLVEIAGRRARLGAKRQQVLDATTKARARLCMLVTLDDAELVTTRHPGGIAMVETSLSGLERSPDRVLRELWSARNTIVQGSA